MTTAERSGAHERAVAGQHAHAGRPRDRREGKPQGVDRGRGNRRRRLTPPG